MSGSIPDTRDVSFETWAAGVYLAFPDADIGNFRSLDWVTWGLQLFQRTQFDGILIPQPDRFGTWQGWGDALRQAADGLLGET